MIRWDAEAAWRCQLPAHRGRMDTSPPPHPPTPFATEHMIVAGLDQDLEEWRPETESGPELGSLARPASAPSLLETIPGTSSSN